MKNWTNTPTLSFRNKCQMNKTQNHIIYELFFSLLLSNFVLESEKLCTSVFDEQRKHVVINEKRM